jgi:prepilin-type processing-associated H-X9-DG protein/prepilin-type N-terminal cleavage/methylation domain-containing protein
MARKQPARAFTLVELLVVIGIIALLIAILMPALAAAKNQANRLKCVSNLRTLTQVSLLYANDNRGWLPHSYYYSNGPTNGANDGGSLSWVDLIARSLQQTLPPAPVRNFYNAAYDHTAAPYYLKIQWFKCPSYPNEKQPVQYVINGWGATIAGGYQLALVRATRVHHSSEVIYFLDANKNRPLNEFNVHDVWEPSHLPMARGSGPGVRVLDDQRHRGLVNIAFLDGHVSSKPFKNLSPNDFFPPK